MEKTKNPIFSISSKESFYYFGVNEPDMQISITINNMDSCDITISFTSTTMQNEVDSWDRLFSLSRRYKDDVICHNEVGQGWIREIDGRKLRGLSFNIEDEIFYAESDRLSNKNFIKAPFLKACVEKGIL